MRDTEQKAAGEPEQIFLKDLPKEYYRLQFLIDAEDENIRKEVEVSVKAGTLVGELYDEILKQYINPESEETLKSLNKLCVRLVFCLYAEDAGIFGGHTKFHDYIHSFPARDMRRAIIDLFKTLDTPEEARDPYADDTLLSFPYVNGGLFADEDIEIPQFSEEIREIILRNASEEFDWSTISPTIFGAVFESTLNPETRRSGGMHYTSIENIHKVIDLLFLDELREELEDIKALKVDKTRIQRLDEYRNKLASLTFLDPACGSGNFLTETYISLRRLENEAISIATKGQMLFDIGNVIKVSIRQFYGIEINDFAVTVAKTALWIAECQMMQETEAIIQQNLEFLPLEAYANIVEGNALRIDWETVVSKDKLNYIMGNPPFVGASMMTKEQKNEAVAVFGKIKLSNSIDYVGAWYHKAAMMIQNTDIAVAFVSTNSITQGEQVAPLWKKLFEEYKIHIDFAHRTFKWNSEATDRAAVHCVIIGFSIAPNNKQKMLFDENRFKFVENINAYLADAPNVLVSSRGNPICKVTPMVYGNKPSDGGNLILSIEEKDRILKNEPHLAKWIKPYIGSIEYINNKSRYCFWLVDMQPSDLRKSAILRSKIEAVKQMRNESSATQTRAKADTPHLFFFISQPDTNYLMVPRVSSENRKYIPIGFMPKDVIASDSCSIVPKATLYHFGVLISNVHMAWMRAVCGRLEMRYRYSGSVVYNNFPWCNPSDEQKAKIEQTAQAILDARALYTGSSLADLYDELTMPPELRKAHQENDKAVMQAYGFDVKTTTESSCVAELMKMYQELAK